MEIESKLILKSQRERRRRRRWRKLQSCEGCVVCGGRQVADHDQFKIIFETNLLTQIIYMLMFLEINGIDSFFPMPYIHIHIHTQTWNIYLEFVVHLVYSLHCLPSIQGMHSHSYWNLDLMNYYWAVTKTSFEMARDLWDMAVCPIDVDLN